MTHFNMRMLSTVMVALFSCAVMAQDATPAAATTAPKDKEEKHAAIQACFDKVGIKKPTPGEAKPKLTEDQKKALHACFKENGIQPPEQMRAQ